MNPTRQLFMTAFITLFLSVTVARAAEGPQPPPAGTFSGEGLTLTLQRDGNSYTGTAKLLNREFSLRGVFDSAQGLTGTFEAGAKTFPWSASLDGRVLKFQTGGTEYKLPLPEPPAASDNPLAQQWAEPEIGPLAKRPELTSPAASTGETLKFSKRSIKDPQINNIEAVSLLIPEGWKPEGGIKWFPDYSILANLQLQVTEPQTGAQIQILPVQNFTWIENPVMPLQPGSNYLGNIVLPPIRDVPAFIRSVFAAPNGTGGLPHLAGARQIRVSNLPRVVEQVAANYGGLSQVLAAKVRYEYARNDQLWDEDVYLALVFTTQRGMTLWSINTAYSFRAPKGELDKLVPLMTACVHSARLSLDWYAGYMQVQQLFANRMNQGIRNAAAISATVTKNSEEIRRRYRDSYQKRCEAQDHISRGFSEYIRGVETYVNPFEDRPIQLPSGYTDAWVNAQGQYILSPQTGFDPNVGSTAEWRRMKPAK